MDEIFEEIGSKLRKNNKRTINPRRFIPSAVLMPIFLKEEELYIIFTKRTSKVKDHKGQISFPGGKYSKSDLNLLSTALRECQEEIGVEKRHIKILGELDDIITVTGYLISPYVGVIPYPYRFKTSVNEVEDIIEVPVSALLNDKSFRVERSIKINGKSFPVYYFFYQGHIIWGATARILKQFLELVFDFRPER